MFSISLTGHKEQIFGCLVGSTGFYFLIMISKSKFKDFVAYFHEKHTYSYLKLFFIDRQDLECSMKDVNITSYYGYYNFFKIIKICRREFESDAKATLLLHQFHRVV